MHHRQSVDGKSPVEMVKALLTLPVSLWQSLRILKQQGADLVFGVGGTPVRRCWWRHVSAVSQG